MSFREIIKGNGRTWNYKIDPVYRIFSRKEYLDDFFERGKLRLTSMAHFRGYKDEVLGDVGEGGGVIYTADEVGNLKAVSYDSALNAYVLCTTAQLSPEVITAFNGVGALKINDPTLFGIFVAEEIPNCTEGVEGHCDYVDHRVLTFPKDSVDAQRFFNSDPKSDQEEILHLTRKHTGRAPFMKPARYAYQREYRFIWFTTAPVTEALTVVPHRGIQQCCERIDF